MIDPAVPLAPVRPLASWRVFVTMGVYHLVFLVGFLVYAPVLLWKMILHPGYREGILQRMGRVPKTTSARSVVWIHGVSVGEVKAAGTLIERLQRDHPECELVVSSTTPTGHGLARRIHPTLRVIYYPLDFGLFPRRALDRVRPRCVLLVELEIWPNFLHAARQRGIPVAVVNGRMSERSFRGYRLLHGLLPQFDFIERYCVQDESYRRRLLALSVDPARIFLTGNIKYDSVALKDPTAESAALRAWLSPDDRLVLVGGSTHGDEEVGLAVAVSRLRERLGIAARLVLAPRHPERSAAVRESLAGRGLKCATWSEVQDRRPPLGDQDIVLVDTIGHLETFYGACDVAFVGGSLVPHGGQNMLEPAALGKAVVFGPHVDNFRTDVTLLMNARAAVQVASWEQLDEQLRTLCVDAVARSELGQRAVAVIRANKGATDRTLAALRPLLDGLRA